MMMCCSLTSGECDCSIYSSRMLHLLCCDIKTVNGTSSKTVIISPHYLIAWQWDVIEKMFPNASPLSLISGTLDIAFNARWNKKNAFMKRWRPSILRNERLTYDTDVKSRHDVRLSGESRGKRVATEEIMGDVWRVLPRLILHHCHQRGMSCEVEEKAETMRLLPQIEKSSHTRRHHINRTRNCTDVPIRAGNDM